MARPKQISFRKSSKGGARVIFNPKIYNADFGSLYRAIKKNLEYDFPKMTGGVKGRLEFFRKFISFGSLTHFVFDAHSFSVWEKV